MEPRRLARQAVTIFAEAYQETIRDQRRERTTALVGIRPAHLQRLDLQRALGAAERGKQSASALSVGSVVILAASRIGKTWRAVEAPPADVADWTGLASRGAGGANQRAQLHRGDRPPSRSRPDARYELGRPNLLGTCHSRWRKCHASGDPSQHPAHISIHDEFSPSVGEGQDRGCRVLANSREPKQLILRVRNSAVVLICDHPRGRMQPECSTRIAEPSPGPYGIPSGIGSKSRWRRPPLHPRLPRLPDSFHGRLLQHELAHHDLPGRCLRPSPRKITGIVAIPKQYAADDLAALGGSQWFSASLRRV
jgi:hypothetical protein